MPTKMDERIVKATPAPAKGAITIWDGDVKGFGLRVYAPTRRHPGGGPELLRRLQGRRC